MNTPEREKTDLAEVRGILVSGMTNAAVPLRDQARYILALRKENHAKQVLRWFWNIVENETRFPSKKEIEECVESIAGSDLSKSIGEINQRNYLKPLPSQPKMRGAHTNARVRA